MSLTVSPRTRPEVVRPAAAPRRTAWAVAVWAALIAAAVAWGAAVASPANRGLTQPLVGRWDVRPSAWLLPAAALAGCVVLAGPSLARTLRFRPLAWTAFAASAAWATALALGDGPEALSAPLLAPQEYLAAIPRIGDPLGFLREFAGLVGGPRHFLPVHVEGHPPGFVLLLWGLARIGLGGAGPAAGLAILGGAAAAPAVLIAARELAGEGLARRAAPLLVLAPYALWIGTAADGFFLGVGAWGAALAVLATGRTGRRAGALAAGGGLLLGAAALLSYGLVLMWLVPLGALLLRRRFDVLALAVAAWGAVVGLFALGGFWWPDGLEATRFRYGIGVAAIRPYGYFLVANLAALAVALGPAAAAGLARLRDRGAWLLAGGALAAVAAANLSGLSKGEVERIWLPFMPWILLAGAAAVAGTRHARWWLAGQAGLALGVQAGWRSLW